VGDDGDIATVECVYVLIVVLVPLVELVKETMAIGWCNSGSRHKEQRRRQKMIV